MYGEGPANEEKNNLLEEIRDFLKSHSVGELLDIVSDAVKLHNGEW
jgi:hypothetical protein